MQLYKATKDGQEVIGDHNQITKVVGCTHQSIYAAAHAKQTMFGWTIEKYNNPDAPKRMKHIKDCSLRVNNLLKEKGLHVTDLLNATLISDTRLRKFIHAEDDLTVGEYLKIAKALEVSACYILTGEEYEGDKNDTDNE